MKIKKGDKVLVIAGADRGKTGVVLKLEPKNSRVLVEKINMIKKHRKPTQANPEGSIVEKEAPIHISNVAILDPKAKKTAPSKVGYVIEKGKKVRVAKKSGAKLD